MNEKNIKQNSPMAWLLAARPKTLTGAAVPVMIGLAMAWRDRAAEFDWIPALLCILFAFVMQIDANFINDYFDFMKGNDDSSTRLGPLRACTQGWVRPESMRLAITITTILACALGLPLVWYGGLDMIIIGAACVLFCFLYTTHLSYKGLGDLLVLIFFGLVPVCCTYYIQVHSLTWQIIAISLACGLVVDTLLLVNNYRDRDNDLRDGKITLVVRIGAKATEFLYLFVGITAVIISIIILYGQRSIIIGLPLLYLIMHIVVWKQLCRINNGRELNKCLGNTARNIFIYGLTISIGLLLM